MDLFSISFNTENMSNDWEKQEGILLQSIPYLGNHRILKVFTPDAGLLTLMAKHVKTKNAAATNPFCRAEWVYRKSLGDIYPIKDATLLDPLDELRKEYRVLSAAGSMANDLLRSQFPQRPAKRLYELLIASLKHLPQNPLAIAQSFRLRLLQFEGLLHLRSCCMHCDNPATHLSQGECLCLHHALPGSTAFNGQEWEQLLMLGLCRRFSDFEQLNLPEPLIEKTERLFLERIHH
jgi:DNA repair protein RecO (recombination protein O)